VRLLYKNLPGGYMKILITSDVHGDLNSLIAVINKHKDINIHLNAGDMSLSKEYYDKYALVSVKGNNDFGIDLPYYRVLDIENIRILLTHGHHENVKLSLQKLKLLAKTHQVQLCIFGHTHQRYHLQEEGIIYVNPGALGGQHSYAIFDNNTITFHTR